MFNIYMAIFIIAAVAIVAGGTMYVNNMGKGTAALLYGIGSLYLMIIYGIKWFGGASPFTPPKGPWPATINTCPDFLTAYTRIMSDGSKQETCIDTICLRSCQKGDRVVLQCTECGSDMGGNHKWRELCVV
jgi:hypothetical protein